jgi:uncharacterized protein YecA (UPF0149 family)
MTLMARLLKQGQPPAAVMDKITTDDTRRGRNDPCPCGNGTKFKTCHGRNRGATRPRDPVT